MKTQSPNVVSLALSLAIASTMVATAKTGEQTYLVKPSPQASEAALHALLKAHGARETGKVERIGVRVVSVPAQAAEKLAAALQNNPAIEFAEPDSTAQALANDPYYTNGSQWSLPKIQAASAWALTTGSPDVVVAVIDTGVHATHPDLAGRVLPGRDFVNNDMDATDDQGHGTAVAGIIGAATNNATGMAGISWQSPILPVKVLSSTGSGSYSAIANGIIWAADQGAQIINLSLGGTSASITLQNAVDYAWSRNAVIIAAAGNNGNDTPLYPAACKNVVAVSATTSTDTRPTWSNFGTYVDLSAPGANILTLSGNSSYAYTNGTSFSSPTVAGVVALMAATNTSLTNRVLVDTLLANCDDIGQTGYDVYYGHGRVQAARAVQAAAAITPPDTSAPVVALAAPTAGETLSGIVTITASASDDRAVTGMELLLAGEIIAQSSSGNLSLDLDTTLYLDGVYALEVRAYDAANNLGTAVMEVEIRNSSQVDAIAPTVAITSPSNGAKLANSTKVSIASSDNVGVTRVELFINGKLEFTSTSANPTFTWNTAKLPKKSSHTLQAFAYDAAGNIGASLVITVSK